MPSTLRDGAARQAGAAAARDEGHARAMAEPHGLDHFVGRLGQDDRARARAKRGQAVGLERGKPARRRQQPRRRQDPGERRDEIVGLHREGIIRQSCRSAGGLVVGCCFRNVAPSGNSTRPHPRMLEPDYDAHAHADPVSREIWRLPQSCSRSRPPPSAQPARGFTDLFNGRSLNGWKSSAPDAWVVAGNVLTHKGTTASTPSRRRLPDRGREPEARILARARCAARIAAARRRPRRPAGGLSLRLAYHRDSTGWRANHDAAGRRPGRRLSAAQRRKRSAAGR